ncbi:MAG: fasciclin domain-containing protein [Stigonema ocellatum SAG 48.90 = DSM 106950]|nr:fasciclin domain-containing protein [Stigonema ocellatum SAG 48.90 = DSM 106950]
MKGRITSDQLKDGQTLTNLTGQILVVHKQASDLTIEDGRGNVADVIQADVRATNGVVYSINKVLQRNVN